MCVLSESSQADGNAECRRGKAGVMCVCVNVNVYFFVINLKKSFFRPEASGFFRTEWFGKEIGNGSCCS